MNKKIKRQSVKKSKQKPKPKEVSKRISKKKVGKGEPVTSKNLKIKEDRFTLDKYIKLKEKYIKGLSNKNITSGEKGLLMNNLKHIEKLIKKYVRKEKKEMKGTGEETVENKEWIENPLASKNGKKTAWITSPLYTYTPKPQSRKNEDYVKVDYEYVEPVVSQRIMFKGPKQSKKGEEVYVAREDFITDEDKRKVIKGVFNPGKSMKF